MASETTVAVKFLYCFDCLFFFSFDLQLAVGLDKRPDPSKVYLNGLAGAGR